MADYYPSPDFTAADVVATGDLTVGGNAAVTGNTVLTGTLDVTGATDFAGAVDVDGAFSVADTKLTVAAATGNTVVAGTLNVTGVVTAGSGAGSASAPNVALGGDANTGLYLVAADWAGLAAGGVLHMSWTGSDSKSFVQLTAGAAFCLNAIISPSLTGSVNDWAPTGINTCNVIRVASDGAYNITGMGGGGPGTVIVLVNISASSLTLKHLSGSSAVGNKFSCPAAADYVLRTLASITVWYDATSQVWRIIGDIGTV
jgi:hypothetical protein